jgi:hypothetical protein
MADAQPTMEMNGAQSAAVRADAPDQQPPNLSDGARRAGQADASTLRFPGSALGEAQSTPSLPISGGVAQGVGAWQNNKKVDALWTINQDRNSWVGFANVGWKKLAGPNETALSAMTMLFAHARATGSIINYRDESDNLIHEVYVW